VSRRARAFALLGLSAICAGLAASLVNGYEREVRAQVGPLVPVLVARRHIPHGRTMTPRNLSTYLVERHVPSRFAPPRSLRFARDALGLRALVSISTRSYVGGDLFGPPAGPGRAEPSAVGRARLVEVPVAGASALGDGLHPGTRVDVLVTSEQGPGAARTYLALQRIELVDFRMTAASGGGDEARGGEALVTLRVTLRQAVLLTAAQNFARELRLVPRAAGDDRRLAETAVGAQDLHP
jgi:pilus assembly protein CpaB